MKVGAALGSLAKTPTFWVNLTGIIGLIANAFGAPLHINPDNVNAGVGGILALWNMIAHSNSTLKQNGS